MSETLYVTMVGHPGLSPEFWTMQLELIFGRSANQITVSFPRRPELKVSMPNGRVSLVNAWTHTGDRGPMISREMSATSKVNMNFTRSLRLRISS